MLIIRNKKWMERNVLRNEGELVGMIKGCTRTCGLLGNPVEHTLSPMIHNTLAESTERELVYVPFCVPQGGIEAAVRGAEALNILGLNVTVPYKSAVIPFLHDIDPFAERIGAVNTLVRDIDGFKGYNTDLPGLYRAMCDDHVDIEGEHVLILGAGGVARAVAMLMVEKGAKEIILMNRTLQKAERVAREVNEFSGTKTARGISITSIGELSDKQSYLAIQATSVGMYPNIDEVIIEDDTFYDKVHVGYDLIFNPSSTRFMEKVQEKGGRAYNGLKMLLYQGILAYELWTGEEVSAQNINKVYKRLLEVQKNETKDAI